VPSEAITAQLDAVFSGLSIRAVKTGMLGSEEGVCAAAERLKQWGGGVPIIVDPVMVSTSGSRLLAEGAEKALAGKLIPLAALITPNLHEAAALLGAEPARNESEMKQQAERLLTLGAKAVLIKGGHLSGPESTDVFYEGSHFRSYSAPRIAAKNTHGTGCTLSSAIAAFLVKGLPMEEAIAEAKAYLQSAIAHAASLHTGPGAGPLWHFYRQMPPG
jgi:hydroxymethylpyrimidine/phosphomethylpyrimidine kinase